MGTLNFTASGTSVSVTFTNGFEEGDFSFWPEHSVNATVQSSVKRTGTYAAKANIAADNDVAHFTQYLLPQTKYTADFYVRVVSGYNHDAQGSNNFTMVAGFYIPSDVGNSVGSYHLGLYESSGSFKFALYAGTTWLRDAATLTTDTWLHIVMTVDTAAGTFNVSIGGTAYNDTITATSDALVTLRCGLYGSARGMAGNIAYFDDFVISASTTSGDSVIDQDIDEYHFGGYRVLFDEGDPTALTVITPGGYRILIDEDQTGLITITTQAGWEFQFDEDHPNNVTVTSPGGSSFGMEEDHPGVVTITGPGGYQVIFDESNDTVLVVLMAGGYEIGFDEENGLVIVEPPDEEVPPVPEAPRPSRIFPRGKATIAKRGASITTRKATIARGRAVITKRKATIK